MAILKRYAAYLYLASSLISLFAGLFILNYRYDLMGRLKLLFSENSVRVPVLMYHHFSDDGPTGTTIAADIFESHIEALSKAGYTTITFDELCSFVYNETPLPQRPVVITIDDGYTSVYEIAYPLLKKYGMKATVFIIGVMHGETLYKDTQYPIDPPHFGDAEGIEMDASGVISIQSHSFDMHQLEPYETGPYRSGVLQRQDESREEYIEALRSDFERSAAQIENMTGTRPLVYSYPFGRYSKLSEETLRDCGVKATLTIVKGFNVVKAGSPESLFRLKRYNVYGDMTADKLLSMIK
ncbi:MAG: polysaccharide deacetylase family protein [Oscillospiraceae bacterium]|nr:polysaccharide deacetylase family protein [Oscillospiraceae bacterium]